MFSHWLPPRWQSSRRFPALLPLFKSLSSLPVDKDSFTVCPFNPLRFSALCAPPPSVLHLHLLCSFICLHSSARLCKCGLPWQSLFKSPPPLTCRAVRFPFPLHPLYISACWNIKTSQNLISRCSFSEGRPHTQRCVKIVSLQLSKKLEKVVTMSKNRPRNCNFHGWEQVFCGLVGGSPKDVRADWMPICLLKFSFKCSLQMCMSQNTFGVSGLLRLNRRRTQWMNNKWLSSRTWELSSEKELILYLH